MSDHVRPTAPSWSAKATAIIDALGATHTAADRRRLTDAVRALSSHPRRVATTPAVDRFLADGESFAARATRFAAVATFAHLGLLDVAVSWPGWSPPGEPTKRLLEPLELALVRLAALRSEVAAVQIALLEAGVSSGELAEVRGDQIGWDVTGLPQVELPGSPRLAARRVTLSVWAWPVVQRLLPAHIDGPLAYRGRSEDPAARQASVLMSVRATIEAAGLGGDHHLAPESIRATGARLRYDQAASGQGLAAAAAVLGIDDVARVADRIGVDLHPAADAPPPAVFPLPFS